MELKTTLSQTDYERAAAALRSVRYVSAHAWDKLDGPELYEIGQAIKALRQIAAPKPAGFDDAIDAYIMDAPEPDEIPEDIPAEFVQPQAPWYLGRDGRLFSVPDFPAIAPDSIPF